jgi:tyrosyl-tRNA synthetase
LSQSASAAARLIDQQGVRINGEKVTDKTVRLKKGEEVILQVGRRKIIRVKIA